MDAGDAGRSLAHERESEGCLLVVAAYAEVAQALGPVAADAAARIMMSPMLGDFIELRFVGLGPRPRQRAGGAAAVARIADELTRPGNGAARNYFALVIADNSAAATEQMLGECGANPIIAALPLRCRGLAAIDDRQPDGQPAAEPGSMARVIVPPSGGWGRRELIDELRGYAEGLLSDFATGHEPGLTRAELGSIRARDEEIIVAGPASPAGEDTQPGPAWPQDLADPPEPAPPNQAPPAPAPESVRSAPSPARERRQGARWHPWLWRTPTSEPMTQPNRPPEPAAEVMAADAAGGVRLAAPLLLILSGDDNSGGHASWNRGRSLLREVDKKLAAASQIDFMVRALLSAEVTAKSTFQRAGHLSRRDIKRPASYVDFGRLLVAARALLKRDLDVLARSRSPAGRPAVVLVALDAPLADAITAQVYQDLVQEASVIWVVPERSADLMSPSFAAGDSQILTDHQGVAEEVVSVLRSRAESDAGGAKA